MYIQDDGYIPDEALAQYGENAARLLRLSGLQRTAKLRQGLVSAAAQLKKRRDRILEEGGALAPGQQWLADNYYLVRRQTDYALSALKGTKPLPVSGGEAAVVVLCRELLRSGAGEVTSGRFEAFFKGCALSYILSRAELDALLPALNAAVIFELRDASLEDEEQAKRLFTALRTLSQTDFSKVVEKIDTVEQILRDDPTGVYPLTSDSTRWHYRRQAAKIAKRRGISEAAAASKALSQAREASGTNRHVGFWLYPPVRAESFAGRTAVYIILISALSLAASGLTAFFTDSAGAFFLSLLPFFEIFKQLADRLIAALFPPRPLPRMDEKAAASAEGRTLCVISALLTSPDSGVRLAEKLEQYRLANREPGENLLFGILADLPDSKTAEKPSDKPTIDAAMHAVERLNEKYSGGFFLFTRPRKFSKSDNQFSAYERKRGAIHALVRLLNAHDSELTVVAGSALRLHGVKFLLTLDEDTRLAPGSAAQLIGAMLHPMNRPVFDPVRERIISGYGVISPRMTPELRCVNSSFFAKAFAGQGGVDPYGGSVSEALFDCFDCGGFAGKGIIDLEAYELCLEGVIPENSVLSHDALEGAYLRGALMSELELTDCFPSDVLSYYRRLHRWVRGDWQNLPWLFGRGSALSLADRFRLFDSARRSLMPAAQLICLLAAFFEPSAGFTASAVAAAASLGLGLWLAQVQALFSSEKERSRRISPVPGAAQGAYLQLLVSFTLMPFAAFVSINAVITALWRILISRKRLLRWTTAAAASSQKKGSLRYFAAMWFSWLLGAAVLIFAAAPLGQALGAVWIMSPVFAWEICLAPKKREPSPAARDILTSQALAMWRYFSENCTARDSYLPPDNLQFEPPRGLAHRTSPTNIGLALLACLCACDLGLCPQGEALELARRMLETVLRLEKWRGHLLNWYDTRTLKPLRPEAVSTADSGNLAVCLKIAEQGFAEYGRDDLSELCRGLFEPMSFAPLYNADKRLLAVSLDARSGEKSEGCYDLFASEARTASFLAVARGDVPLKHWSSLSRALLSYKGCRGMASWTGSMFEYLMPSLFFTAQNGSLLRESERLCVAVQRKKSTPWGSSEGAYYSLDSALDYRYAPHGCAALALQRGMDEETVITPYATFLALKTSPEAATANLRELGGRGLDCEFGLYEALDLSPGRRGVVKSVMAHHLGMSLVAACNALRDEPMPLRLQRCPEVAAYSILLDERLPLLTRAVRRRQTPPDVRQTRAEPIYWERREEHTDFAAPTCCLLSNGVYSLMLTDSGSARASCNGCEVYLPQRELTDGRHGLDLYLIRDGSFLPLLPCPDMPKEASSSCQFSLSAAKLDLKREGIRAQQLCFVSEEHCGEKRVISLSSDTGDISRAELLVCFEPLLAPLNDYVNHPAYCKLGMAASLRGNCLLLRRLPRNGREGLVLCLALSEKAQFSVHRSRSGLPEDDSPGWLRDGFVTARVPVTLSPDCGHALSIALALGSTEDEAYFAAQKILTQSHGSAEFLTGLAARLQMSDSQLELSMETLTTVSFPAPRIYSQKALWRFGISGDAPIIAAPASEKSAELTEAQIKARAFLGAAGVDYDLALITEEGGYLRPVTQSIAALLEATGAGRVVIVDASEEPTAILDAAALKRERSLSDSRQRYRSNPLFLPEQSYPALSWDADNSVQFYVNHSLPPRVWGNMLTNSRFGYFATDCGSGHCWYSNAREYQLTPWNGDAFATFGETLELNGESLFAGAQDEGCLVSFGFGYASWQHCHFDSYVNLTAFVPPDTDARVFLVTGDLAGPVRLRWGSELSLGPVGGAKTGVTVSKNGGVFTVSRQDSPYPDRPLTICSSGAVAGFTSSRELWRSGKTDDDASAGEGLWVELDARLPFVLVLGCDDPEKLQELCRPEAAELSLHETRAAWRAAVGRVNVSTPLPELDRLVNGWLPYQALACRLMGRTGVYQCGGATGFRDQLQDAVNLLLLDPALARSQIITCCSRQYVEGDVMHWWHDTGLGSFGVRTRCSDDLLWLVWAVCEYIDATGDTQLLRQSVPFLSSQPLQNEERDRYEKAAPSAQAGDVLDHCRAALDLVLRRGTGRHGLLKIGSGDWNDGLSEAGVGGEGESVWLTWFFCAVSERFALYGGEDYREYSKSLAAAANAAWDTDHFLRGYFDDGTPIGSNGRRCCQIDSTAQSFAALCPYADADKADLALTTALNRLYDRKTGIVKLLDPPFENSEPYPGYIESYGPGFRENGGQYTHGAIFLIYALIKLSRSAEALELLRAILPPRRDPERYAAEPYVIAADVCSAPGLEGSAGWSWYTGSAGWLWRTVVQELLGVKLRNGELSAAPRLPEGFGPCTVTVKTKSGEARSFTLPYAPPKNSFTQL